MKNNLKTSNTPLDSLEVKDSIRLSDAAYHTLRVKLGLQESLPPIYKIKNTRQIINKVVVQHLGLHPTDDGNGSVAEMRKVLNLIIALHHGEGIEEVKITWDERNNNGSMFSFSTL